MNREPSLSFATAGAVGETRPLFADAELAALARTVSIRRIAAAMAMTPDETARRMDDGAAVAEAWTPEDARRHVSTALACAKVPVVSAAAALSWIAGADVTFPRAVVRVADDAAVANEEEEEGRADEGKGKGKGKGKGSSGGTVVARLVLTGDLAIDAFALATHVGDPPAERTPTLARVGRDGTRGPWRVALVTGVP